MTPADIPKGIRLAIPPPPSQNETLVKALAKHIIEALETQMEEGTFTLSEIANELRQLHDKKDLNYINKVNKSITSAIEEFSRTKETGDCIPVALEEVKLHFCAQSDYFEKPELTFEQKEQALKAKLKDLIVQAIKKRIFRYDEIQNAFSKVYHLTDVEHGAKESIIMDAVLSICNKFMDEHGKGNYVHTALFNIQIALTSNTLL